MSDIVFCPATMCPLFAADGSPWTGHKNAPCEQQEAQFDGDKYIGGCAWYFGPDRAGKCGGCHAAHEQIGDVLERGGTLQIGPVSPKRHTVEKPRTYDCPRAHECQWQRESGDALCPPRRALSLGVDPRNCAY